MQWRMARGGKYISAPRTSDPAIAPSEANSAHASEIWRSSTALRENDFASADGLPPLFLLANVAAFRARFFGGYCY